MQNQSHIYVIDDVVEVLNATALDQVLSVMCGDFLDLLVDMRCRRLRLLRSGNRTESTGRCWWLSAGTRDAKDLIRARSRRLVSASQCHRRRMVRVDCRDRTMSVDDDASGLSQRRWWCLCRSET